MYVFYGKLSLFMKICLDSKTIIQHKTEYCNTQFFFIFYGIRIQGWFLGRYPITKYWCASNLHKVGHGVVRGSAECSPDWRSIGQTICAWFGAGGEAYLQVLRVIKRRYVLMVWWRLERIVVPVNIPSARGMQRESADTQCRNVSLAKRFVLQNTACVSR